jgi:hypothetical protein
LGETTIVIGGLCLKHLFSPATAPLIGAPIDPLNAAILQAIIAESIRRHFSVPQNSTHTSAPRAQAETLAPPVTAFNTTIAPGCHCALSLYDLNIQV